MRILVACEESQAVCIAFRERGHEAYSCDVLPCSGGHPEWHIQDDVTKHFNDGWDMMIAFPPCTHLAVSGARHFEQKRKDGRQQEGIDFFLQFTKTSIPKWAIENPVGIMSGIYRQPNQIISPHLFGDPSRKKTCLWLNNLPKLEYCTEANMFYEVTAVEPELYVCKNGKTFSMDYMVTLSAGQNRGHLRSKTYPGIANAMATQWS